MNILRAARGLRNSSTSSSVVPSTKLIEEETLLHYKPSLFFPVRFGQIFNDRYKVEAKLGFGGSSTVWLCRDQKYALSMPLQPNTEHLWRFYLQSSQILYLQQSRKSRVKDSCPFRKLGLTHDGRYCVRQSCDQFEIEVFDRVHHCLVYEPLGMSLLEYVNLQPDRRLSMKEVAWVTTYLLIGLDYLHKCRVVHTDPVKIVDDTRVIYTSRTPEYGNTLTYPIICDLGMAAFGQYEYEGLIQPIPYRAPEVILGMKGTSSVDIWNMGVLIWELLFSEQIFGNESERGCLRKIIAYLGPLSKEFLQHKSLPSLYFDEHGKWLHIFFSDWSGGDVTPVALQDRLEGADVELFLDFITSMLRWVPEERKSAAALLKHPWLNQE
ncbi:kinase-like domain-containing protein [Xylogone sp. PMI_703]|nr:kinase-like domain-containing protein [Xylogone sp. PMI_703]